MQMTLSAYGGIRGYKRRRPKLGRILIVGAPSRQKRPSASQRRSTDGVFCPASGLRLYAHPLFFWQLLRDFVFLHMLGWIFCIGISGAPLLAEWRYAGGCRSTGPHSNLSPGGCTVVAKESLCRCKVLVLLRTRRARALRLAPGRFHSSLHVRYFIWSIEKSQTIKRTLRHNLGTTHLSIGPWYGFLLRLPLDESLGLQLRRATPPRPSPPVFGRIWKRSLTTMIR
jgi:hypothetical protein